MDAATTPGHKTTKIRTDAHRKLSQFASRNRMNNIDALDVAIDALMNLTDDERRALIQREAIPKRKRRSSRSSR